MKKVFFMALLLATGLSGMAQNEVGQWSIQPKVGINIANMTNTDNSDPRVGLVVGAEAEVQATPLLGISVGALYSQQGCKASGDEGSGTLKLDYIDVPVLANFYVAKGFALKVGVQPGFKVNDKVKVKAGGASAEVGIKEALRASGSDADLKSFDLAIPFGLSYCYRNIQLDARYNLGVTKVLEADDESTHHAVFQITLGYRFQL